MRRIIQLLDTDIYFREERRCEIRYFMIQGFGFSPWNPLFPYKITPSVTGKVMLYLSGYLSPEAHFRRVCFLYSHSQVVPFTVKGISQRGHMA